MHSPFKTEQTPEVEQAWKGWVFFTRATAVSVVATAVIVALVVTLLTY
jgi:hypothetical protein